MEHVDEDRMSISNIVDIDGEDEDEIEESRTSKRVMKEKQRLKIPGWLKAKRDRRRKVPKKFQLMIIFESQEKDDVVSLPPMTLMNLLSTISTELVEFGREAMIEFEVFVQDVPGDSLREMSA